MSDYKKYGEKAFISSEKYADKIISEINKNIPDNGLRLLDLIKIIPNWETYLTPKQLEVAKKYVKYLNATEVDYSLDLNVGTTQQRLFGGSNSKGALGRLEEVKKMLEEQGYFINKAAATKKPKKQNVNTNYITENTKKQIKELLQVLSDIPDYEQFLTASQNERIYSFLQLKSIKVCAEHFNIEESTFKQSLFGRGGKGGILGRLKEEHNRRFVNTWDL